MRLQVALSCAFTISAMGILLHTPIVTPTFAQASRFCENYAHDYATRRARGGVIGGTAVGATAGGVIGGIANGRQGARRGAAIGGLTGLVAAGSARSNNYDFYYRQAFARCTAR